MNKSQVINAWQSGRIARTANGSLSAASDGTLRSYNLPIGIHTANGLIVGNFTASGEFHSMTTSHHVSNARQVAKLVTPEQFKIERTEQAWYN